MGQNVDTKSGCRPLAAIAPFNPVPIILTRNIFFALFTLTACWPNIQLINKPNSANRCWRTILETYWAPSFFRSGVYWSIIVSRVDDKLYEKSLAAGTLFYNQLLHSPSWVQSSQGFFLKSAFWDRAGTGNRRISRNIQWLQ